MRAISEERFSRISGPMRHDDAVMMMSSEKTFRISTSPSLPHSRKYSSASSIIFGTIASSPFVFIECTSSLTCCCRSSSGESYTMPFPKTGMVKPYTGAWSRTSSLALMNWSCGPAPIIKVMRCGPTLIVNIERYRDRYASIIPTGPLMKSRRWPSRGRPPDTSGGARGGWAGSAAGGGSSPYSAHATASAVAAAAAGSGQLAPSAASAAAAKRSGAVARAEAPHLARRARRAARRPAAEARGAKPSASCAFWAV
mmetsp:Transcript_26274/g.76303  ORF Transcript_26274/g.76303 Transcript_26274/m.76303 type:complete len:255 (+) Transcript_26274:1567-2331(+)